MKLTHSLSISLLATASTLVMISPAASESVKKYVALGDSYAAGVGISNILDDNCQRSDRNYAHLFAAQRGYTLTDSTCGGGTIDTVTNTQLSAVTSDTTLVTLGVGGNDIGFSDIVTACVLAGTIGSGSSGTGSGGSGSSNSGSASIGTGSVSGSAEALLGCKSKYASDISARLASTTAKLTKLVSDIKSRAPQAHIIFVGYPKILPDNAALCSGRQPVLAADVNWARDTVIAGLNTMLRNQSGTEYFSTYELYEGHDICQAATDRWINGTKIENGEGQQFHPNEYGHAATAQKMIATIIA